MASSNEFKQFLKTEAETCQGAESDDSLSGFIHLAEWYIIWAKACEQFAITSAQADQDYAFKVIYACISSSLTA